MSNNKGKTTPSNLATIGSRIDLTKLKNKAVGVELVVVPKIYEKLIPHHHH
ncbi:hypothetical protein H6G74_01260 [Nostoc spongiaeforme FACHB-130]|uniref:Uncharacterized protein n=1 Tax=Nostoc spongiaeforme FACHB-130 TaxID=1357510 RepID=A0ABR8FPS6_9NOSO|nr:hypothetical protein [Nostoc spongiaeforme]MBD2592955.1 hypothetical protein [Nostoc spongiaeforme FACHB-130]